MTDLSLDAEPTHDRLRTKTTKGFATTQTIYVHDGLFDILYWSLRKERWVPFGLFGGPPATIDQALRAIANAPVF